MDGLYIVFLLCVLGIKSTHICVNIVSLASAELPHWTGRQVGQTSSVA